MTYTIECGVFDLERGELTEYDRGNKMCPVIVALDANYNIIALEWLNFSPDLWFVGLAEDSHITTNGVLDGYDEAQMTEIFTTYVAKHGRDLQEELFHHSALYRRNLAELLCKYGHLQLAVNTELWTYNEFQDQFPDNSLPVCKFYALHDSDVPVGFDSLDACFNAVNA